MATYTSYFPGSVYPEKYNPPMPGVDYIPTLGELLYANPTLVSGSSTKQLWKLSNGLKVELTGSGLKHSSGEITSGTVTGLKVLLNNGSSVLVSLTDISWKPRGGAPFDDGYPLQEWLLRGSDVMKGGGGHDELLGFAGADKISGGAGNDYFEGGLGKDTYDGGAGEDVVSFVDAYFTDGAKHGIKLDGTKQTVLDPYGNNETFKNVEGYRGTQFADTIMGSSKSEQIIGFGGKDTLDGKGGVDLLRYNRDDRFGGTDGVTVNLTNETATDGFGDKDIIRNFENVRATERADKITGSAVANVLEGLGGNDNLSGEGGSDKLYGGAGRDTLSGGSGNDKLVGDAGNDTLYGGSGKDLLYGGTGADRFVFKSTADSTGASVDTIYDFSRKQGDRIHLGLIDADVSKGGDQDFTFIGAKSFSGKAGELRYVADASDTFIYADVDGNKKADLTIYLDDKVVLVASDFIL